MTISSKIEFVKYFAKENKFFAVRDDLFLIFKDRIVSFDSEDAKHLVNINYQDVMNELAPTNNFLMQNIKSRVLANPIPRFDRFYQRFMQLDERVICDLINDDTLVLIDAEGYQVVNRFDNGYLNFMVSKHSSSLPIPKKSSKSLLNMINQFTNFATRDELILFTCWLISLAFSDLSSPILIILGEQGSGKSFTSDLVKRIIDPSMIAKQHKLKSVQDFAVLINHSYLSIIDNLSQITDDISDVMCQTVSNGQYATRKLYTDNELSVIDLKAKLIINGITIMNTKPDLLERSIVLSLDKISGCDMKSENEMLKSLDLLLPEILDQLYSAVSHTLSIVDSIEIADSPRMADFTRYLIAIASFFDITEDEILKIYRRNIKEVSEIIIDDPVIQALLKALEGNGRYEGSMTDLLELLSNQGVSGLPKAANSLSSKLTRLRSELSKEGITIRKYKDTNGNRVIEITKSTAIRR